jgi:hypothetical protein
VPDCVCSCSACMYCTRSETGSEPR